jgi:branched-chain amino acid transport system ATP-binding protein
VQVPEERALFGPLTVEENLRMGAWTQKASTVSSGLDEVFELFPVLAERRRQAAETFSGGQQQMLAIGRALMTRPKLLMLDEPSTGLSPKLTWAVLDAVKTIRDRGVAVLLVEQNAHQALRMADRAYVLESGSCVLSGAGPELAEDDRVRTAYLGL